MYWPKVSDNKKNELDVIKETLSARGNVSKSQAFGSSYIGSVRTVRKHTKDRSAIVDMTSSRNSLMH